MERAFFLMDGKNKVGVGFFCEVIGVSEPYARKVIAEVCNRLGIVLISGSGRNFVFYRKEVLMIMREIIKDPPTKYLAEKIRAMAD